MGSIVLGIWALIIGTGFMNGFMVSYMADVINHDISNIQIHNPEFKNDYDIKFSIPDGLNKAKELASWEGVRGATARSLVRGMISSAKKASGIEIRGIDPETEARVTRLDSIVVDGRYFKGIRRNPLLLGEKLARELNVRVKSKVVLTFNDGHGEITAAAFRVAGIIKSSSVKMNGGYAFVLRKDLNKLLGLGNVVHEIALVTDPLVDEDQIVKKYHQLYPNDLAETWSEIAPELNFMQEMYGSMLYVLMGIIMTALVFGIINTMLMAVLERIRELGMLMAVGMVRAKVYLMVMVETIFLSLAGAPVGLGIGWLTIKYFRHVGLDLSNYSAALETYGYSSILYPYVETQTYFIVTLGVIITAIIGAMYPSWKAIHLKPVEALHKI